MIATQTAGVEAAQAAARVAPVAAGVQMRRRPALVAVSVALVVLGAVQPFTNQRNAALG